MEKKEEKWSRVHRGRVTSRKQTQLGLCVPVSRVPRKEPPDRWREDILPFDAQPLTERVSEKEETLTGLREVYRGGDGTD